MSDRPFDPNGIADPATRAAAEKVLAMPTEQYMQIVNYSICGLFCRSGCEQERCGDTCIAPEFREGYRRRN